MLLSVIGVGILIPCVELKKRNEDIFIFWIQFYRYKVSMTDTPYGWQNVAQGSSMRSREDFVQWKEKSKQNP